MEAPDPTQISFNAQWAEVHKRRLGNERFVPQTHEQTQKNEGTPSGREGGISEIHEPPGSDTVILAITGAVADAEVLDTNTAISDERLDYILDSITRYQHLDLSQYDNAVICVQYSSRHSVSDAALTEFYSRLKVFFGYDDIRTGKIVENGDEREVKAVLLLNKM